MSRRHQGARPDRPAALPRLLLVPDAVVVGFRDVGVMCALIRHVWGHPGGVVVGGEGEGRVEGGGKVFVICEWHWQAVMRVEEGVCRGVLEELVKVNRRNRS